MTFILDEDKALKDMLKDMLVTDQKSVGEDGPTRKVGVYYGQPDQELTTQMYPYITIDLIDISEDFERATRGWAKPVYMSDPTNVKDLIPAVPPVDGDPGTDEIPATPYDADLHNWQIHTPVPVNLDYQITSYSRQPRHDREILAQLMFTRLPFRYGVAFPDDGTVRRLSVLDVSKRDITEAGKRLFVNAFTVRISSEIAQDAYTRLYKAQVIDVTGTDDNPVIGRGTFTPISYTITAP